jgi:hypothetical protein
MRPLLAKFVVAALVPAHVLSYTARAETLDSGEIRIGVREDARPFIWRDQDTKGYLGFFWDICTEAVQRAGYHFSEEGVDAKKRAAFLKTGDGDYDLLCDPTTITLKRMQNFAYNGQAPYLAFSPIVFVANGSYVKAHLDPRSSEAAGDLPKDAPPKPTCMDVFNWLKQAKGEDPKTRRWSSVPANQATPPSTTQPAATAGNGLLGWLEQKFDFTLQQPTKENTEKKRTFEIWGYVKGSTIGDTLKTNAAHLTQDNWMICPREIDSHSEAADEFCNGRLARYFGDVDIIKAALADYGERTGTRCAADTTPTTEGTYEPYAIVVSSRRFPDFPERITLALYGMFEDGTVERLFSGHFPGTQKSQHLATLFRINSIPAGSDMTEKPGSGAGAQQDPVHLPEVSQSISKTDR